MTLGIYTVVWYYKTHEELKRHTGTGIGGAVAVVLALFVGIAMPFLTAHEVGKMYERRGQEARSPPSPDCGRSSRCSA